MLLWSWCIFFFCCFIVVAFFASLSSSRSPKVEAVNCLRQQKEELNVAAIKGTRTCTFFASFGVSKIEKHCLHTRCFCGIVDLNVPHNLTILSIRLLLDYRFLSCWCSVHGTVFGAMRHSSCHSTFVFGSSVIINDLLVQSNRSQRRDQ